jgi:hypoxanthine phosphoribosyltransferase
MPAQVLLTEDQISQRVVTMAREIRRDAPDDLHLIAVLKGAFVFLSDLMREIDGALSLDFIALSSYGNRTSTSGEVRLLKDLDLPIEGLNVVVVEDIVDSGLTLAYLKDILHARGPRSLKTACLLSKPSRRQVAVHGDYVGFEIEDRFVVGYGLDHDGRYRNLPHIAALD